MMRSAGETSPWRIPVAPTAAFNIQQGCSNRPQSKPEVFLNASGNRPLQGQKILHEETLASKDCRSLQESMTIEHIEDLSFGPNYILH